MTENANDRALNEAAFIGLLTREQPSKILRLQGSETFLLEVDFLLLKTALEKMSTGKDETDEQRDAKMKKWIRGFKFDRKG